jgi:hypothetical protein
MDDTLHSEHRSGRTVQVTFYYGILDNLKVIRSAATFAAKRNPRVLWP